MSERRLQDRSKLTICPDSKKTIVISGSARVRSLVFLEVDSLRHLLSGSDDGMIRQWSVDGGVEVEEGMKTNSIIATMTLSGDGNWIVSSGLGVVNVWNRRDREIVATVSEHADWVHTIHVSPDSTKFATGSNDRRVFVWDISTGARLVGPLEHEERVAAVRFSPDGDLIVTGTAGGALRIYAAHNGDLLRAIPVSVASYPNNLITWSSAQSIFALVSPITLMHIDVNTGQTLSSWTIPGEPVGNFGSIVLSRNGKFIAAFVGRSISLWGTSTSARISSDIQHPAPIRSIALSLDSNYLAVSDANANITLRNLNDIISNYYIADQSVVQQPKTRSEDDLQPQFEALYGKLRVLELRFGVSLVHLTCLRLNAKPDALSGSTTQPNDHPQVARAAPLRISDGAYRIKSNTDDLYLTCPQDGAGTVVAQQSEESSVAQRVRHYFL